MVLKSLVACVGLVALIGCSAQPFPSASTVLTTPAPTATPKPATVGPTFSASPVSTSGTASPTPRPTEQTVATPSPSPRSLVIPNTPFANVGSSEGNFGWSPDGTWLLARQGDRVLLIRTSDLSLVRTYDVPNSFYAASTWIDTSSFFLFSSGMAWRGTVSDARLDETTVAWSTPAVAIGFTNGRGAVAFWSSNINGPSCADCAQYRIWAGGSLGNEQQGWAEAWSPDGSRLAVIHPLDDTAALNQGHNVQAVRAAGFNGEQGWLEVLSYPELQPVYSNPDIDVASVDMAFSPSGRYLLVEGSAIYQVLDLDTQKLTDSPANWPVHWYGDDELATREGRDLVAYSVDGTEVQRWKDAGDGPIGASPDGRLLVTTDHFRTPKNVTVIRDDQMSNFQLPSLEGLIHTDLIEATPANDGRSIVLLTETPAMFGPLLVLQIPD